ncbi:MAG: hypothetical protein KatS3mg125_1279 [Lysobacterales bacterium]|nr:MAG: hypothetical protein KatS3mg125_1279 [Xanthomonadales bacterium]
MKVKVKEQAIQALLSPSIEALGFECLGVEWSGHRRGGRLRVFIDGPEGVRVEDCERVSREIEPLLDLEDPIAGTYTLEVSSPGIERPLFTPLHFERHRGETVTVTLAHPLRDGRRRLQGIVRAVHGERIQLDCGGESVEVNHEDILRARLVADWQTIFAERSSRGGKSPSTPPAGRRSSKHE